ncbi:MAG TPA: hypothetical protein VGB13_06595, partial [Candidatus Krumholzibacteria bacterium]
SVTDLQLAYGLSPFLEVAVDVPLRSWSVDAASGATFAPASLVGFGDLLASGKLQLPLPWRTFRLGGFAVASLPTGSRSRGMSSETTDVEAGGLLTLDFTRLQRFIPTRFHLNGSYRWNRNEARGIGLAPFDSLRDGGFWPPAYPAVPLGEAVTYNDQLFLRAGLEFTTGVLDLWTEYSVDLLPQISHLEWGGAVSFLTQGATVKLRNGLDIKLAAGVSLQDDVSPEPGAPGSTPRPAEFAQAPDWRLTLGFSWRGGLATSDDDQDGIPDSRDGCPKEAEDFDGFEDQDGCPDLDNDQDGVPDAKDLAPDLAEDKDGFEDEDGRPDMDNDADGITDDKDECPNEPEDFDGDRDLDGCPDLQREGS